ncbi:conjugative transposon TraK protein [Mesoflavibacter sabulilitoris]|uniref:Conjugative transposon protein TraK n=1 Tax=Mesoflavibacter zeaxanthinifaciens subsp. sabulilitoris TaxID=1520893 RepID=A0A2T1NNJ2_9FLAO|nr:conjugative transposon protein TraK [Mesoflavibacter zeaxanthinifaciens]MBB3125234.1 conjugative transposon TraK protein [Mesoflavibacter zeaxanthinifaciens subsp. sabulilitoris]PSG94469.1 conjugative transposon protein TraK [Mesoflavibacter zeaxanthinifaciens subsp. sabulilitoris]
MEYKIFSNLEKQKRNWTFLVIVCLVITFSTAFFCMHYVYKTNESVKNRYYVLDNNVKMPTVRIKSHRKAVDILCEGHITLFHDLFFSVEPDLSFIKKNIETKALYMIDDTGLRMYNELQEQKYFSNIVLGRYSIIMEKDSINIDYSSYPYQFEFYGKQRIEKGADISYRNLITKGSIKESGVTPNNLNGLIIENLRVINNKDVKQ